MRNIFLLLSTFMCSFALLGQELEVATMKKTYRTSTTFKTRMRLPAPINQSSGLIFWNNRFWTHNDDNGTSSFFSFEPQDPQVYTEYSLDKIITHDWESIAQDDEFLYFGDFGNNHGNRTDLQIVRLNKAAFLNNMLEADTIRFAYATQTDFSPQSLFTTEYDCEAFIVTSDSIYLFTKAWSSVTTTIYSLPKVPGNYLANQAATYNLGLVTDAVYLESKRMLVLCGYSRSFFRQFLYAFCNSEPPYFFQGNTYDVTLNLGLFPHQIEGIESLDGKAFYVTNEHRFFSPERLHRFNLSDKIYTECSDFFYNPITPAANDVINTDSTNHTDSTLLKQRTITIEPQTEIPIIRQ